MSGVLVGFHTLWPSVVRSLIGFGVACVFSVFFAEDLWTFISEPAVPAFKNQPHIGDHTPMEQYSIIWVKLPMLVSLFLASPVFFWQVWEFLWPRLSATERRWAIHFVSGTSVAFIAGGLFAFFAVLRPALNAVSLSGMFRP